MVDLYPSVAHSVDVGLPMFLVWYNAADEFEDPDSLQVDSDRHRSDTEIDEDAATNMAALADCE